MAPPIERFSPHHCILLGERPPFPRPTRPKTPKVCVITSPGPVAPKHAGYLPGTMQTTDSDRRLIRVYNAYFSAFPARAAPARRRPASPYTRQAGGPHGAPPSRAAPAHAAPTHGRLAIPAHATPARRAGEPMHARPHPRPPCGPMHGRPSHKREGRAGAAWSRRALSHRPPARGIGPGASTLGRGPLPRGLRRSSCRTRS